MLECGVDTGMRLRCMGCVVDTGIAFVPVGADIIRPHNGSVWDTFVPVGADIIRPHNGNARDVYEHSSVPCSQFFDYMQEVQKQ